MAKKYSKLQEATKSTKNFICELHMTKSQKEFGLFIVEGFRCISTFLNKQWKPAAIYVEEFQQDKAKMNFDESLKFVACSSEFMNSISASSTPSGVLAVFEIPRTFYPEDLTDSLVLFEVSDPGNLGTLIRSAVAFNFKNIYLINSCNPYLPKVVQSAAGALTESNLIPATWQEILKVKDNVDLCALVVKDGIKIETIKKERPLFLIIGNEARGLSSDIVNDCNLKATIEMPGQTESLNAAIAGSIALYLLR